MPENIQSQTEDGEISNTELTQTQEGETESPSVESSPTQQQVSSDSGLESELKAIKAQHERMKEDYERALETSRILESYVRNQGQAPQKGREEPDEYADVDKTLGPWLQKSLKPYVDNFSKVLTGHFDRMDQLAFLMDRLQEDPEMAERLQSDVSMDEIDRYRMRIAQTENRFMGRSDALQLLRGMKLISEKKNTTRTRKVAAANDEAIRKAAADATGSGEEKPGARPGKSTVPAAVAKMRSGARLTDQERAEARKFLESQDAEL